jgi:hypothetical protein
MEYIEGTTLDGLMGNAVPKPPSVTLDSAVLLSTSPIPFSVVQKRIVEENLYLMRLEAWMREHWVAMPIVLTLVSAVLFAGPRVVLGNYRRAHPTGGSVQNTT